jgi:chromate reductase, NAD(P)H dehydrogenase (quinone)
MNNSDVIKIIGISGSVRTGSYNLGILRAAGEMLPEGTSLDIAEINDIPLFSQEAYQQGFSPSVEEFRRKIAAADAILFATPEYIFSISARLKNAIEWAYMRPDPPFFGKPCAIAGATVSPLGSLRGQYQLRQICTGLNTLTINAPQVDIADAQNKFDSNGNLTHQPSRELVRQLLVELRTLATRLRVAR